MTRGPHGPRQPAEGLLSVVDFGARIVIAAGAVIEPWLDALTPSPVPGHEGGHVGQELVLEPLRVLAPGAKRTWRRITSRMAVVIGITLITLLLPTPPGLTEAGHRALGAFAFTGSILALEPVSLPIAALLVPVAIVALNVGTITEGLAPFASPTVFLVLASLFLAEALRKHGLTRRLALITTAASGGDVWRVVLGLMAVAAFFSMWVENTATAAILIPVAMTIARQVREAKAAGRFLMLLVLGIAYAASLGGMATIMGSAANAVASEYLSQVGKWTFFDWFKYGLPSLLLVFPITFWLLKRLVPIGIERLDIEPAREQLDKLGSLSPTERTVLTTMIVAIFFWVTGSGIESLLGLPPTLLSATIVAIVAVGYLSVRGVLEWEDVKGVSWGVFFVIGAGLSLGEALTRTGATEWIATLVEPIIVGPPLIVTMLVLVYVAALMTNLLNNTTITAVLVPVLISLSMSTPGMDPVTLAVPVALATTFGYSLPSASGRMALVASTGIIDRSDMMRYGLIATLISAGVLGLFFSALAAVGLI